MKKEKSRLVTILINLGAMLLITLIVLTALFKWMHSYTRHGLYITVPNVTGLSGEQSADTLAACGLQCDINDYKYDANMPEGSILEQRPRAGAQVKAERIIHLTANSGKIPTKAVPDVADNSSLRAAESKLIGAGFKLTEPEYIPGDADWVYEVRLGDRTLRNGEMIPEGSTLTVVVGNGGDALVADSLLEQEMDSNFF